MDLHLKGKVVAVTGGAAGIGRAAAEEFLKEGALLAVCGRTEARLEAFAAEMKEQGFPEVYTMQADVSSAEQMNAFAAGIRKRFGRIDVWVNNAGIAINKFFLDYTEEEWDRIQSINLKGVWNGCRAAAPYMQEQESGVIINISSFAAKIPLADGPIYAASKAGVSSLTQTLAADLAPWGIRVMGVIPGMIRTAISEENIRVNEEKFVQAISMKRLGLPEDLAKPVVFIASDAAAYMSGFDIEITGGKFAAQNTDWPWQVKKEREV